MVIMGGVYCGLNPSLVHPQFYRRALDECFIKYHKLLPLLYAVVDSNVRAIKLATLQTNTFSD